MDESLARLEQILGQHRYLTGNQLTEADIRLWTTLVRFDPVYVTHFKCDKHRISDYLNLYGHQWIALPLLPMWYFHCQTATSRE